MKITKILAVAFIGTIAMFSIYAEEPAKTDTPALEKKDDKKLELNVRIQARAVSGQTASGYAGNTDFNSVDFNIRRLRLATKFEAAPWVGGIVDIKGENLIKSGSSSKPVTSIGAIQEVNIWFKPGFLGSEIKVGQFKLPFLREQLTSSGTLLLNERGYSEKILQQMDIGLLLQLKPLDLLGNDWKQKLDIAFSVTNGDGSTHEGIGSKTGEFISTNKSLGKLVNWRVQINPFGGIIKDGKDIGWKDGEEIFQDNSVLWSLGAAGAHTSEAESGMFKQEKPFNGFTFDTTFFAYGIYVNGEYTTFSGDAIELGYSTYQGTVGYNIKLGSVYLMPLLRYNYLSFDADGKKSIDDNEKLGSIWIGANLFALKHDVKFQIFYNMNNDATTKALKKDILYFQIQTNFGKKV